MSPLDRTARRRPATGEAEKATRRGLTETAREVLQRTVRTAATLAHGDSDFLDRLRDAGVRVRERRDDDGALVGYSVALPGDHADRGSRPVWFAGSTLAYDLSLPRVRERYEPLVTQADRALAEHRIAKRPNSWAAPGRMKRRRCRGFRRPPGRRRRPRPGTCPRPCPAGGRRLRAGRPRPRRPHPGGPRPSRPARRGPRPGTRPARGPRAGEPRWSSPC